MAVGQSSLYIWKAIVTQAITFHYLYHQNNGHVNNIFCTNYRNNGGRQQHAIQVALLDKNNETT